MKHALTGETADAVVKWVRCGACEAWLTEVEAMAEECGGQRAAHAELDPDEVRRVLVAHDQQVRDGWRFTVTEEQARVFISASRAWLRLQEQPPSLGCAFCNARTSHFAAVCVKCRTRTLASRQVNVATSPTVELVINACAAAYGYEVGAEPLMIFPEGEGYREAPRVVYHDSEEYEDTIAGSLRKMYDDAVAKIRERRAVDTANLERLGVAP